MNENQIKLCKLLLLPLEVRKAVRSGPVATSYSKCVQELIMNSIDASATEINVSINLEKFLLRVEDNGKGIPKGEMLVVGRRYFTNKVSSLQDLEKLDSYGYRGEALASITEYSSDVRIMSKVEGFPAYCKKLADGKHSMIKQIQEKNLKISGTIVSVKGLLSKVPVRQKRIEKELEIQHIKKMSERVNLLNYGVTITVRDDLTGAKILHIKGSKSIKEALQTLDKQRYGCLRHEDILTENSNSNSIIVNGVVSQHPHPDVSMQFLFVNKHYIPKINARIYRMMLAHLTVALGFENRTAITSNVNHDDHAQRAGSPRKTYDTNKYPAFVINLTCSWSDFSVNTRSNFKDNVEFRDWDSLDKAFESFSVKVSRSVEIASRFRPTELFPGGISSLTHHPPSSQSSDSQKAYTASSSVYDFKMQVKQDWCSQIALKHSKDSSFGTETLNSRPTLLRVKKHGVAQKAKLKPTTRLTRTYTYTVRKRKSSNKQVHHNLQQLKSQIHTLVPGPDDFCDSDSHSEVVPTESACVHKTPPKIPKTFDHETQSIEQEESSQVLQPKSFRTSWFRKVLPTGAAHFWPDGDARIKGTSLVEIPNQLQESENNTTVTLIMDSSDDIELNKWHWRSSIEAIEVLDQTKTLQNTTTASNMLPLLHSNGKELNFLVKKVNNLQSRCSFSKDDLATIAVIGQVDNKFIAAKIKTCFGNGSEIVALFDQHAVHERVRLEKLITDTRVQKEGEYIIAFATLSYPICLNLSDSSVRIIHTYKKDFAAIGLELETLGSSRVKVSGVPKCFVERISSEPKLLRDDCMQRMLQSLIQEQVQSIMQSNSFVCSLPKTILEVLKSRACKGAIKFGEELSLQVCSELMNSLKNCKAPFQCAHGRPVVVPLLEL